MGADHPQIKNVFLRTPRAIKSMDQIGGLAPLRGQTPKLKITPIFLPPFLKIRCPEFSNLPMGGDGLVGEYFVQIWARSDEWKLR